MARVNINLADDVAKQARDAGLNVSALAREAVEARLRVRTLDVWLERVQHRPDLGATYEQVMEAIGAVGTTSGALRRSPVAG